MDNEKPKMSYKNLIEYITDVPEQLKADPFEQQARKLAEKVFQGGILINADLNGALNIIRKVVPDAFVEGIEAVVVPPTRTLVA